MTPAAKLPTVVQALSAVMGDVQAVGKSERNQQQGYVFRGVDAVVNAVGPALREHGVVVVPVSVEYDARDYQTTKGTLMRGITAKIGFRFYGPAGDYIDALVAGESSDSGDKAVPKAHSVAYRTLLLQALCIPTDEADPDASSHERASVRQLDDALLAEVEALEKSLLILKPDVAAAVNKHREGSAPEGHKIWLERAIAKALKDAGGEPSAARYAQESAPAVAEAGTPEPPSPSVQESAGEGTPDPRESGGRPPEPPAPADPPLATFPKDTMQARTLKKLDVVVVKGRDAGHFTTEDVYVHAHELQPELVREPSYYLAADGLHYSDLRSIVPLWLASQLIDKLEARSAMAEARKSAA
jgi:hypothetical protein